MRAKKSLGQNFLMHARIAERMVDASGISANDTVVEVGPGTGMLTRVLLARARKVVALETDDDLIPVLQETFAAEIKSGKLVLIHTDVRTWDPASLKEPYAVVANIPYYITGELLRLFLSGSAKPQSLTVLVQKEVAERIARAKKESLLSVSVKVYGTPRYAFTVPRGAFMPAPNVDSAVLTVGPIDAGAFPSSREEDRFFEVLRAGFAHKRKLVARNLEVVATPTVIKEAFMKTNVNQKARAEDLSVDTWRALAKNISI